MHFVTTSTDATQLALVLIIAILVLQNWVFFVGFLDRAFFYMEAIVAYRWNELSFLEAGYNQKET